MLTRTEALEQDIPVDDIINDFSTTHINDRSQSQYYAEWGSWIYIGKNLKERPLQDDDWFFQSIAEMEQHKLDNPDLWGIE